MVGAIVLVTQMRTTLETLDEEALRKSIDRFTMLYYDDVGRLQPYTRHAAWQKVTAEAAQNVSNKPALNKFIQRYLNTSLIYNEDGTVQHVYRCGSLVNWWGIIHPKSFATMWSEYHPGNDVSYCTLRATSPREPAPVFPPDFFKGIIQGDFHPETGWISVFRTVRVSHAVSVSIEAIMIPDEDGNVKNKTIYGYLVAAKTIQPHLSTFADNVPGCISMISGSSDEQYFTEEELEIWNTTKGGTFSKDRTFTGEPTFTLRDSSFLEESKIRYCPAIPLFNNTQQRMTGYFKLCGLDPEKFERTTCLRLRMDRPLSRIEEGTNPVILLSVLVVGLMIVIFVIFIVF